ncbi:MAG: bifunctional folylpolyglutamate synthase/dihydrofolate synthase [Sphingobacteriia bacterium]
MLKTFAETVDYLYTLLPAYQHQGGQLKLSLEPAERLLKHLGNPHRKFRSVHVGGTNGKGSVTAMLSAVLQQAGYRVGLFTSPHLFSFAERLRLNGQPAPADWIVDWVNRHRPYIEAEMPSFFELTFGMACDYYAQQQVDIAIMEVGMGGRLDSTNVLQPILSVITNVSWDHAEFLGDTLPKIAAEKAGIIKPGVPCILGEYQPEVFDVFVQQAEKVQTQVFPAWYGYTCEAGEWEGLLRWYSLTHQVLLESLDLACDLGGDYQAHNLPPVMMALDMLAERGYPTTEAHILAGLQQVRQLSGLRGRFDILAAEPLTIADVAHNEAGLRSLLAQVLSFEPVQLHIVLGMVREKDRSKILTLLPPGARYYYCSPALPRALPAPVLQQEAAAQGLQGQAHASVQAARAAARAAAQAEDLILICGSVFTVAEALA